MTEDELPPVNVSRAQNVLDFGRKARSPDAAIAITTKSHADLKTATRPEWLVKKVLPAQGLATVYGPSGSGKSFLVMDICAAVAMGRDWFGHKVRQADVLYCALEGSAGLGKRCDAWAEGNDMDVMPENFRFCDVSVDLRQDVDRIVEAASGANVGIVVIDTLNQASPGMDENSSRDMGEAINAAKQIQEKVACLVILVHHTGKDTAKGLRGHSSLYAAMDCVIEVARTETGRSWSVTKSKEDAEIAAVPFDLEIVKLGHDEDGDPITSCYIGRAGTELPKGVRVPTRGNARLFYEEFKKYAREYGKPGKGFAPAGTNAVHRDDAVDLLCKHVSSENRAARTSIVRTLTALVDNGALQFADDYYWIKPL